jgi:fermentation-respiration switch protein FrsA (DUF1100 family)
MIARKKMIEWIVVIVAVYLASLVYLYLNQRHMMYFPDTSRPAVVDGAQVVNVTTSDGLKLEGWFFASKENKPVIVVFHGNGGNISHRMAKVIPLTHEGYGVLLAEYRGYGGNPGTPGEEGFYSDARAWMDWLKTKPQKIVIDGESIGSGVAVKMATEYDIAGLILESPYTSITEVAQSIYPIVPVGYLLKDRFPSIDRIKDVKAPILIIHGKLDRTIPVRFGQKLYMAAPQPKNLIVLDQAGHNDLYDQGAALHVLQFLSTIGTRN